MKITDLRIHSIAMADPPLRSSYGLHQPYALRNVVEVESEDGIIGIAETYGGERPREALENLRGKIVGADALRILGDLQTLTHGEGGGMERSQVNLVPGENPLDTSARTYAAIETACLDLVGQSVGKPVCDLIGGRVREKVSFSAYLFYKHGGGGGEGDDTREDEYGECLTPGSMVSQTRQMIEKYGFESIKLKAGVLDPEQEVETIRQLRQEFGKAYPLRIDPNSAWKLDTSLEIGRTLKEELSEGGYLEDPCAGLDDLCTLRRQLLAEGIDTPNASNVAVTSFAHLPENVNKDAVQVVLCDHHYWGGMRQVQHLGKICQVFGLGLSMHSNSHLGVSLMAMAHVAAATPHLTYDCDTHYPWQSGIDEIVEGGRIPITNGCVSIPEKPGLGITLDHDQLSRGRERYEKCPYRKRDDAAEMRKYVDPDWQRILPRW